MSSAHATPSTRAFLDLLELESPHRFLELARTVLGATLRAGDLGFRPLEVELYLHSAQHPDPYAHQHPSQAAAGRWYFHRQGSSYRGGTYKGLDLSFGASGALGGILIRALQGSEKRVSGPCRCVETLLGASGHSRVADLDGELAGLLEPGPLQLELGPPAAEVIATARVGLGFARASRHPTMRDFFGRPYRFLTDARIPEGRTATIVALHEAGHAPSWIADRTGAQLRTVEARLSAYAAGQDGPLPGAFDPRRGDELASALGAWRTADASSGFRASFG